MAINRIKNQAGYIIVAHSQDFGDCYLQITEESYRLSSRLTAATIFGSYTELKDYLRDHGTDVEVASKCKLQSWRI